VCALTKISTESGCCLVHNLGSGNGSSVLDMVKAFEKASGKTIPYKIVDRRPGDLACVIANAGKAKRLFVGDKGTLEDMCNSAWKWQSQNPYGYDEPPATS